MNVHGGGRGGFGELGRENLIFELFGKSSFQKNRSQELKTKTKIPNRTFKKSFLKKNNILREKSIKFINLINAIVFSIGSVCFCLQLLGPV